MNQILAAFIFFTRLPFWKIKSVPDECFKHVVSYWSFSGWLTGGIMAICFWGISQILPVSIAVIAALTVRLLITGALHEDGLADFFDGFGGGRDRESTLRIMKDSHIGTYGVLALIIYYLLGYQLLSSINPSYTPFILLCCDSFCKFVCSHILWLLPYARKEEESKAKVIYSRQNYKEETASAIGGLLPLVFMPHSFFITLPVPILVFIYIQHLLRKRLGGYTGDCCGASFLICELSMWFSIGIASGLIR